MKKLSLIISALALFSLHAGEKHPYQMTNEKAVKIVNKAAFYSYLHFGANVFGDGVDRLRHSQAVSASFYYGFDALANKVTKAWRNLSNPDSVTKKILIEKSQVSGETKTIECKAFIEYSKTSKSSPQALANVELYDCEDDKGQPYKEYHFSYARAEVSLIMAGKK